MKRHGMLLSVMLVALLLLSAGCGNGDVSPSPTVNPTVRPTANPTVNPTVGMTDPLGPLTSPLASPGMSPGSSPGSADGVNGANTIEGFKEGETVEVAQLPDKVTAAVKDKYPEATIKSAAYATYMDGQMYHLMLEGASDNTTEIYAQADGTLLPYNAQSTPAATNGGGNGGSGSGSGGSGGGSTGNG